MSTKEKRPASPGGARRRPDAGAAAKKPVRRRKTEDVKKRRKPAPAQSRPAEHKAQVHSAPSSHMSQRPQRQPVRRERPRESAREQKLRRAESQVVYTPPKAFNRTRFLLSVLTVAAVVLALTLGMSIFFKVKHVTVSGTQKYTAWDIHTASGIQEGDNLMTLGKAKVGGRIITELPYVEKVRIGIKLPDTVNIEITESEVFYAIQAEDSGWWFINAQGRVLDMTTGIIAEYFTKVEGVRIQVPIAGQQAIASTQQPSDPAAATEGETQAQDETQAPTSPVTTVNASEQLNTALAILQNLERNGIIGDVTSVNVTDLYNLELNYDDRYQVLLGDASQMDRKIRSMRQAAAQMTDYQQGTLDASFTIWPDKVGYTPITE